MPARRTEETMGPRWAAVAQVVMALGEALSIEALVGRTLDQTLVVLEADAAGLYIFDPGEQRLDLIAERGLPAELIQSLSRLSIDADSITARAGVTGEVQLVPDLRQLLRGHSIDKDLAGRFGFRSLAAVPLRAQGHLVGVISFATRRQSVFGQTELAMIEVIAHALASGIMNARAFETERRMRTALQAVGEAALAISSELEPRRVLQAIVDGAREVASARYAALGVGTDPNKQFDPWVFSGMDEAQVKAIGPHPRPHGLLGAVVVEGRVIRLPDLSADPRFRGWPAHHPPMRSFLGVPIRLRGETIGNLYLADKIGAAEFSIEDQHAVESLAAHAGIAIRHADLYEQAHMERNRLRTAVSNSPLAIIFIEAESGFVLANKAAEELFGHPIAPGGGRDQYLDQFRRADGGPLPAEEVPSNRALAGELVVGSELLLRRPDGGETPVLVNAAPIKDSRGEVTGAVVIWQDASPLKLEQLREEFISLVAHELRTPIAIIAGYGDLLSRRPQDEVEKRATESIRHSARRLERLVQDLLDASRIEARRLELDPRPLNLGVFVQEVLDRLTEVLAGKSVRYVVHGSCPDVVADGGRIEQVLINLLTNAAKYSSADGEICVELKHDGGEVVLSVHNDGPGIPSDELPRLFTRFYRLRSTQQGKVPGIGLGLYIARGLVEAHGGRIWAASESDQGVTFSFALPVK